MKNLENLFNATQCGIEAHQGIQSFSLESRYSNNLAAQQIGKASLTNKQLVSIALANLDVLNSIRLDQVEFTNFQNRKTLEICIERLDQLLLDLKDGYINRLRFDLDYQLDTMNKTVLNKLRQILSHYTDLGDEGLTGVIKLKIIDPLAKTTSFRLYLKGKNHSYKVILIDPLHLSVLSKRQHKVGEGFQAHKTNNLCMNKHIIQKYGNLKDAYKTLKEQQDNT